MKPRTLIHNESWARPRSGRLGLPGPGRRCEAIAWRPRLLATVALLFLLALLPPAVLTAAPKADQIGVDLVDFERNLDTIRQALKIPGMSAAVVRDQQLIWARGFGYADLENQVTATPDTPYGLASVTKPIAATLIMGLVEEGVIDLDAPVTRYGVEVPSEGVVTVRHLLTHTSEGIPGAAHDYNGGRYGRLGGVIEGATGMTFAQLLSERFLVPLGMTNTALNPFNSWGGPANNGLGDFARVLGWGANWSHHPNVYARLARPYQFDDQYDIIKGMYQLYHNPAAGLISSVTDIARFDIALDEGQMLGDAAKEEMFAPAYSTYNNRRDLQYGLGWYVQDLEGLRLLWHTGRWSPSTSALYLKAPDENLTFVVLANTDNLTTPFYGIGNGDVSQSTLALAFWRHFIFPRLYGYSPPPVDWQAGENELIEQLSVAEDEASRVFLERELWSYRQAYSSVGQAELAEKLRRVNVRAYPQSRFRSDPLFTATSGTYPVVAPVASASSLGWIARAVALWLALVVVSAVWMVIRLARTSGAPWWERAVWLLAASVLGPIALCAHVLTGRLAADSAPSSWRRAAVASVLSISGYSVAWALVLTVLVTSQRDFHPLMVLGAFYLAPLLLGLLLIRAPLRLAAGTGYGKAVFQGLLTEILTLNLSFAVCLPLIMTLQERVFTTVPGPTSPFFWGMIWFVALAGALVLLPLHLWMSRRGYSRVPARATAGESGGQWPTLRNAWGALLTTLGILIAAVGLTVSQLG